MSEQLASTFIIAFFASLAPTLAALAALMVGRGNGKKADGIIQATAEIHSLTNSNLTRVSNNLEIASAEIEGLKRMIAGMNQAKGIADTVAEKLAEKV